jgi:hypothetical protein
MGRQTMSADKTDLDRADRNHIWRDNQNRLWEWSDYDGWVVDRMAAWSGWWPDGELTFRRASSREWMNPQP